MGTNWWPAPATCPAKTPSHIVADKYINKYSNPTENPQILEISPGKEKHKTSVWHKVNIHPNVFSNKKTISKFSF